MDDQFNQFGQQQGFDPNMGQQQGFDPNQQYQQFDQGMEQMQYQTDTDPSFNPNVDQQYNQGFQQGFDPNMGQQQGFQQGFDPNMQQMQYQGDSEPSFVPNQAPNRPVPTGPAPEKKSKKGLIIGLSIAGVVLVAAALLVFVFDVFHIFDKKKKNNSSAEAVVEKFFQAIGDADADSLLECVPDQAMNVLSEYGASKEDIQTALDFSKGFGLKVENVKILSTSDMSVDEAKSLPGTSGLDITEAKSVKASATMKMSFMGQDMDDERTYDFVCAKIDGKWYIVSNGDTGDIEWTEEPTEIETQEGTTSAQGTEATTEAVKVNETAPSKVVAAPAGLSENLMDTTFAIDGKVVTLPCALSEFGDKWKMEDELSEEDKKLEPKDDTLSYGLTAEGIDEWFYFNIGFVNDKTTAAPATDGKVYRVSFDMDYVDDPNAVPSIILPKGITWGSNSSDIKKAYGEPSYYNESEYGIYLYYYDSDYNKEVDFTIDPEKGLTEIDIYNYSIQYGD